jgi:hypothetical protein
MDIIADLRFLMDESVDDIRVYKAPPLDEIEWLGVSCFEPGIYLN